MRHARPEDLAPLAELLDELRRLDGLRERRPGNFSRGSSAFLHFHADPAGMFADLEVNGEFRRYRVSTVAEQRRFLATTRRVLRGEP